MAYNPERKFSIGQDGNALVLLIAINLTVFILLTFIKIIYWFTLHKDLAEPSFDRQIMDWVVLPADMSHFITRPWTLFTHFFSHTGVWHILGNMLWLWMFGSILQDLSGNRKIAPIYIYGALAGALAYILSYNFFPPLRGDLIGSTALGASAGVMAIAVATAVLAPNYRLFPMLNGGIPIWVITLVFVIIDLGFMTTENSGGHIAHLAGGAMGGVFMWQASMGKDWGAWMNRFFDWVNHLFDPERPRAKVRSMKKDLFYKSNKPPFTTTRSNMNQSRIDAILDKISQKGYDALTAEEKDILKRASKEDL